MQIPTNLSKSQQERIQAILDESRGMWKPRYGENYYQIDNDGEVLKEIMGERPYDTEVFAIGNFYRTEEEAKIKVEWLKAVQRIKEYIAREFGEFEPDWSSDKERKHHIYYNFNGDEFDVDWFCTIKVYSPFGYLRSSEHAEQLIKDCEADLKIVFNVK